jgi:hypothetical protein
MYDTEDGRAHRGPSDLLAEDFRAGEQRSITNSEVYETPTDQIETREQPRRESKKSKSSVKKRA